MGYQQALFQATALLVTFSGQTLMANITVGPSKLNHVQHGCRRASERQGQGQIYLYSTFKNNLVAT